MYDIIVYDDYGNPGAKLMVDQKAINSDWAKEISKKNELKIRIRKNCLERGCSEDEIFLEIQNTLCRIIPNYKPKRLPSENEKWLKAQFEIEERLISRINNNLGFKWLDLEKLITTLKKITILFILILILCIIFT